LRRIAGMVGDRLNVYPVKGDLITVQLDNGESKAAAAPLQGAADATIP